MILDLNLATRSQTVVPKSNLPLHGTEQIVCVNFTAHENMYFGDDRVAARLTSFRRNDVHFSQTASLKLFRSLSDRETKLSGGFARRGDDDGLRQTR